MDDFTIWLGQAPRAYPHATPVQGLGYIRRKASRVQTRFATFNFSFILSGVGDYSRRGKVYEVRGPCVITEWPGEELEYGPRSTWEELYVIYRPEALALLERANLANEDKPVWYLERPHTLRRLLMEIDHWRQQSSVMRSADVIDRICESMALHSWLGEAPVRGAGPEAAVRAIRRLVAENAPLGADFDALAHDHGLSTSTFRRHWQRLYGVPPARYVMQLRMRSACRLLVESELSIGDIAARLGFEDALYFSRKFRQMVGSTATRYRARHRTAPFAS